MTVLAPDSPLLAAAKRVQAMECITGCTATYHAEFRTPDGRWWALTLEPVEARSASNEGE